MRFIVVVLVTSGGRLQTSVESAKRVTRGDFCFADSFFFDCRQYVFIVLEINIYNMKFHHGRCTREMSAARDGVSGFFLPGDV